MDVHTFGLTQPSSTIDEITSRGVQRRFVRGLEASPGCIFVGHSWRGLVIYRFLERYPKTAAGRVVLPGNSLPSPVERPSGCATYAWSPSAMVGG